MKKLIVCIMLVLLAVLAQPIPLQQLATADGGDIKLLVDGTSFKPDTAPILANGVTLVPLRNIAEQLGADIHWDSSTTQIIASKDGTTVIMAIGQIEATRNGVSYTLKLAPKMVNGITMVPIRWFSEAFGAQVHWSGISRTVSIDYALNNLPVVGSYENLKTLLADSQGSQANAGMMRDMQPMESSAASSKAASSAQASPSPSYSTTNVQVQGVDEADIVKTDGSYIYQAANGKVVITKAYPADTMKIVSTLSFDPLKLVPHELYIDGNQMVVIGTFGKDAIMYEKGMANSKIRMMPPSYLSDQVKAAVYDITDRSQPKLIREATMEGQYVTSRKIGSSYYFIANKYVNYYSILNDKAETPAPKYSDSIVSGELKSIGYENIRYFPGQVQPNYLLIGGFDLDAPKQELKVTAYLGSGQNVYASDNHLYVAVTDYTPSIGPIRPLVKEPNSVGASKAPIAMPVSSTMSKIYKFALKQGQVDYLAEGQVPGTILNQYSMDEHNGNFRIATTSGDMWRQDAGTSKNNLYILDAEMHPSGKVENMAPGERIYSVRFLGDRAYMVTYRSVDPLFVLDVSDPKAPKILGSLKIPGYSDYLHPYDDNHIIGFGKDTIELPRKDGEGNTVGSTAFYEGMKVAVFDVTDVAHPVEMFKTTIGDRGTDSELLRNPKALLFSKEKGLLSFPVTVSTVAAGADSNSNFPAYGQFSFQGAYVYHIDLNSGLTLQGKITHLSADDIAKAGLNGFDYNKSINRALYIDDTLYTVSNGMIKANALSNLKEMNRLDIPQ